MSLQDAQPPQPLEVHHDTKIQVVGTLDSSY